MRLQWLAIGITLIATFSTFGYPLLFDRLYIGLLAVTALISFKWDKNLFTLCVICIGSFIVEEIGWFISLSDHKSILEIAVYSYLVFACYITRYSRTGKISIAFAAASIAAECYWLYLGKDGPELYWYLFICANSLVVKHLVLLRPHYCSLNLTKHYDDWKITKTDIDMGYLLSARVILEFLNVGEYLMRHLLDYSLMIIYENYNIFAHTLLALTFYIYLRSFTGTLKNKLFPA